MLALFIFFHAFLKLHRSHFLLLNLQRKQLWFFSLLLFCVVQPLETNDDWVVYWEDTWVEVKLMLAAFSYSAPCLLMSPLVPRILFICLMQTFGVH